MKEVYRIIKEFNGRYQVSNFGNVYSARKKDLLKPYKMVENGQYYVGLCKDGIHKHVQVGKLVLQYFRPSQIPQQSVLHSDLNRKNNISNNVTWGTRGEVKRETIRIKNKARGVYAYNPLKNGTKVYRAALKIEDKIYTLGYSHDKQECEMIYLEAYFAAYGVLPYVD